ncbi:hypothetical protein GCM10010916_42720 [Paenibacillus abyssi]|uniref:SLH domain-containing protein n=2 Tax=Paenibacillus abyssi TaxID=1340531 RepID=A0A917G3Q1_9BACL|nr:hypothetical protein GCM10010916_42720 [Paenibacillus abyssi]
MAVKMAVVGTLSLSLLQAPLSGVFAATNSGSAAAVESSAISSSQQGKLDPSQAKVTKEEAEKRMRDLFPMLDGAELRQVEFGHSNVFPPREEAVWNLHWEFRTENGSYGFSTSVDAMTGDVLSYHQPYGVPGFDNQSYYPPKVSKEEAEQIAKDFIAKASSSIDQAELFPADGSMYGMYPQQLFGPVQYYFQYNVLINGIKSQSESLYLTVDGNGDITMYNHSRYQGQYPSPRTSLTAAEAEEKFKSGLGLTLHYVPDDAMYPYNSSTAKWRLAYVPGIIGMNMLDGHTGKFMDYMGADAPTERSYEDIPAGGPGFTAHQGATLTSEQAVAVVTKQFELPEDYTLRNSSLSSYWRQQDVQVWNFYWSKDISSPYGFNEQISAEVDADTGRLLGLNRHSFAYGPGYSQPEVKEATITEQQAKAKALGLIRSLYPNAAQELKLVDLPGAIEGAENSEAKFRYQFQMFYGDHPILNGSASITLDGDGKLYGYNSSVYNTEKLAGQLDGLKAEVTVEEAERTYSDALDVELQYVMIGGYYMDNIFKEPDMKLVYAPVVKGTRGYAMVDAVSGKLLPLYGNPTETAEETIAASDIEGHWANEELTTLLEHGVLKPDADGLLGPNEALRLGDWLNMMGTALYGSNLSYYDQGNEPPFADVPRDSEFAASVQRFVAHGWLERAPEKNLGPEQTLTRQQLAVLLTKMLNYSKLARYMDSDLEIGSLKDAKEIDNIGAAAVVTKLGLLTPSNGRFSPDAAVTKAQAAVIIMRLVTLQGKTDTPLMR